MKRDPAQTIFRTVVFAGAMLGSSGCSKKPAPQAPRPPAADAPAPAADAVMTGTPDPANPCAGADPCEGGERPRGSDGDGGGGVGRGFILS